MSAHPGRFYPQTLELGNIRDVESFCRRILDRLPNGMYLRPDEYPDELSEMVAQLVDWYRPVDPAICHSCQQRRGAQHAWECDALRPQRTRRSECLGCGVPRHVEGPAVEVHRFDFNKKKGEWIEVVREYEPLPPHAGDCPYWTAGPAKRWKVPNLTLRRPTDDLGRQIKDISWGCKACGARVGARHAEMCPHRHELQQRYDPGKTDDFSLFARYKLLTYYVPDLCRRLLGRTGGRIAERSHSELDERADAGRRPWESAAPEQDDLRARLHEDPGGGEAGRDRARARGAALLGLRPA